MSREALAEQTNFEVTDSTFERYVGILRHHDLIEVQGAELRLSESVFLP